jgi:AbrB family looped-hinge helix DNA binding protein
MSERKLGEAAPKYRVSPDAEVTMSSKRQITLPAAMVRELGLEPGAKLEVYLEDGEIVLHPKPQSWLEYVTSARGRNVYGQTKEEVDEYIRWVREGWDEHARRFEGDTYVDEND